jgi:hypothetical protein
MAMKLMRLVLASAAALWATSSSAVPLRAIADLQTVRVYEITFGTVANDFAPNDSMLTTRLGDPLTASNRDFSFVANEYYDVFYSDSDGTPNPDGAFLTIDGVWRSAGGPGGMNINEVELVFGGSNPHSQFGDFVSRFVYGTGNVIVGSEALAVDHNLGTFPRFGNTSTTDLNDRFSLTIGFNGFSVPEPEVGLLLATGAGGLALFGRRRRT